MRIYFVFSPRAVETNPTVHHANGTLQMLAQFFLSLSAVKQARPVLSTTICSIFMERNGHDQCFFLSCKKKQCDRPWGSHQSLFYQERPLTNWVSWPLLPWIYNLMNTNSGCSHGLSAHHLNPHARFPLNNRNMFTMALDHQVQVFLVSKPQPRTSGIVRNLHASGIRCFHMHVCEPSAKPSLPHRPQTCLKET